MPTPVMTSGNIKKHLTNAERDARRQAEGEVTRKKRPQLRCPKWLSQDARERFEATKKRLKGLQLLDNVDVEPLARYADISAKYWAVSKRLDHAGEVGSLANEDDEKACQSWARLMLQLEEKLGLTPTARARLAKRKAEKEPPDPLEQLLDDVTDYVNDGNGQ